MRLLLCLVFESVFFVFFCKRAVGFRGCGGRFSVRGGLVESWQSWRRLLQCISSTVFFLVAVEEP